MILDSTSPFKIDFSNLQSDMTPHGGVELWLPTASRSGVFRNLPAGIARGQGWTEGQLLLSLCLLNILGYECAEDLDRMEADEGLFGLVRRHERRILGLSRRQLDGRHRKGRTRTFPSPRSMLHRLHDQHDEAAARERCKGSAYVPPPSASLLPLQGASRRLVSLVAEEVDLRQATVDIDATIIASYKNDALPTYRSANGTCPGERGYLPLNCFLSELGMMLYSEMRDGNVPAREGNARLPETVREVTVRSDSTGHGAEVIRFCNRPELRPEATRRFGVVGFAISAVRSSELKAAVEATPEAAWSPLRRLEERTRQVLSIHAARLVPHGRQLILKLREQGTEELQAALERLGARPPVPGTCLTQAIRSRCRAPGKPDRIWILFKSLQVGPGRAVE